MMKMTTRFTCIFAYFSIIILLVGTTKAQELDDESGFNYIEGGPLGPSNWGNLRPEWNQCRTGQMQSPINLQEVQAVQGTGLNISYNAGPAIVKNRGHDIAVEWTSVNGAGTFTVNGTQFVLRQVHWHSPSEHAINGTRYALEAHLVHNSSDGRAAVIGVLYRFGLLPEPFQLQLQIPIALLAITHVKQVNVSIADPRTIGVSRNEEYYRYMGSLTTPPCTEGVTWTVLKRIRTVSRAQVELLRRAVDDDSMNNARPLQPINNRVIQLITPTI